LFPAQHTQLPLVAVARDQQHRPLAVQTEVIRHLLAEQFLTHQLLGVAAEALARPF
jgi:hypothetical protein